MKLKMLAAIAALGIAGGAIAAEVKPCCKDGGQECCKKEGAECCKEHECADCDKKKQKGSGHEGHGEQEKHEGHANHPQH
jgi:hypothetical protein